MKDFKNFAAILLLVTTIFASGCGKNDDSNEGDNSDTHEYIDLGLPSGTLWATCNVGASSPEAFGDFFAWGEVQPKSTYNWNTYKYCVNGDSKQLIKYCNNASYGYHGFTDGQTYLKPLDDAATMNWGIKWRTPTKAEWEELFRYTTITDTTWNGVSGMLYSSRNGKSVFLPASGFLDDEGVNALHALPMVCALYWSSTLSANYPSNSWSVVLYYMLGLWQRDLGYYERNIGLPIRPVRSAQ